MPNLLPFFLILLAGVVFSELFRRLHLPWVIALVLAGVLIGPHGLRVLTLNGELEFLASIGLVFLMFMAGLETRLSSFAKQKGKIVVLSLLNGLIPFFVGIGISQWFGYNGLTSILFGIIFISTSIAVVIPALEASGLMSKPLGKMIVAATVVEDVASLVLLSLLLQFVEPTTHLPLPLFYLLLLASLVGLRYLLPRIRRVFSKGSQKEQHLFEEDLQVIFAILVGTVVLFELLGLHSIIAGFFAGLVLSESIKSSRLKAKLHAIGYGLFIPVFFVVVGAKTDLGLFIQAGDTLWLTGAILLGSVLSKLASGWLGARLIGLSNKGSLLVGVSTIPQLSTTLAVAFAGMELGIIDSSLIAVLVVLSFTTTFLGPFLLSRLVDKR